MRKPHYWRPAGPAEAPSEIVVLDTETHFGPEAACEGGEFQTLRVGVALAYRLEGGRRTRKRELVFRDPAAFWELVRSRLNDRRPVWVVGHNLPYDLGVVGGWRVICSPEYQTQKAAVSGQMFFIKGYLGNRALNFVDTVNYYRCSLKELGKAVGVHKDEMPEGPAPDADWVKYCKQDVAVTAAGLDHLIAFVRAEKLGPWQPSIASLSFAAFRARFLNEKVLVHNDPRALFLERAAYYGGIVETAFVGRVPAPRVHELDVVSMFPAVARCDLPIRKRYTSERVGPNRLRKLMEDFSVIAEVDIATEDYPYPVRMRDGTYYPVGRFTTTLAHPELRVALDRGHIKWVRRVAWYVKAPIFRDHMEYFTSRKAAYNTEETKAFRTLCKYYANSLYGKTGQLSPVYRQWGKEALQVIEDDEGLPSGTLSYWYDKPPTMSTLEDTYRFREIPHPFDLRCYYGTVEIRCREQESRDSCPAIAATITSAARVALRSFQAVAGCGHWFYSDTDSVWVDGRGRDRLHAAGLIRPGELGYLEEKDPHEWLVVYGPKDYETDRVRRVKGLKVTAKPDGEGGWCQLHFPGPAVQIKDGKPAGVFVRHVTKHLHRQIKRCKVLPDGFTRPLVFPGEIPKSAAGRVPRAGRNCVDNPPG